MTTVNIAFLCIYDVLFVYKLDLTVEHFSLAYTEEGPS